MNIRITPDLRRVLLTIHKHDKAMMMSISQECPYCKKWVKLTVKSNKAGGDDVLGKTEVHPGNKRLTGHPRTGDVDKDI